MLFRSQALTDLGLMQRLASRLDEIGERNAAVQRRLRAWAAAGPHPNPPRLIDQASIPWFAALNRELTEPLDAAGLEALLARNDDLLFRLALEIDDAARADGAAGDEPILASRREGTDVAQSAPAESLLADLLADPVGA